MDFDAIVIGTGFGGTIAATRLALKGKKTLMLERGTWWITPEKLGKPPPATTKPLLKWLQENNQPVQYWPRPDHTKGLLDLFACVRHRENRDGLYQYSRFRQADIVSASGVGGGSLIYSNVTLRPKAPVLQQIGLKLGDPEFAAARKWMEDYRGKLSKIVTKIPLPGRDVSNLGADDYLYLDRSRALRDAAAAIGPKLGIQAKWEPLDLAVIEYEPDTTKPDGTVEKSDSSKTNTFCERQGRCVLGCLPAARHTLNKTIYGKMLANPAMGVAVWPLAEARSLRQIAGGYEVTFIDDREGGQERQVTASQVFLAGGTLGTTEILLRSRDLGGLPLNDQLGTRFSTNGDFGAFAAGTAHPVYSTRGPVNTCHVSVDFQGSHINIEDCAVPEMFANLTSTALRVLDNFFTRNLFKMRMIAAFTNHVLPDLRDLLPALPDTYDSSSFPTEAEMVSNLFFFNAQGQDDASGKFSLVNDELDLDWDTPIADHPVFQKIETLFKEMTTAMGGRYVPFPLWEGLASRKLVIPHPLGGCPIGATNSDGVVDEFGRVLDGSKPAGSQGTLAGLYVVDGAAIPGALAANPTMTIAAQALKTVQAALP